MPFFELSSKLLMIEIKCQKILTMHLTNCAIYTIMQLDLRRTAPSQTSWSSIVCNDREGNAEALCLGVLTFYVYLCVFFCRLYLLFKKRVLE